MVWLGFGVSHPRDLVKHLGHYPLAWFDEVVRCEYGDLRVPSFLVVTVLIGDGPDYGGWSVGLAENSAVSAIVL